MPRLLRYSPWDGLVVLAGIANVAFLFWTFAAFPSLPAWATVAAFIAVAWCYCWNLQSIAHNFIHNPFFTSRWLNRAFSVLNTIAIGVPQVLYHHYHMNHHFGDNDRKGPDGTTKDWSSIYRYGPGDEPEAFWRYCLIGFFRAEVGPVVRKAMQHGQTLQLLVESIVLAGFWAWLAWSDWRYVLFFYVPSYYLGWVLSYAEGYLEHYGCQPGNPYANSVSSYHRLYNLFWFNNGYHQEHHWDPKWHWTRMSELHARIASEMEANGTRTLRGPHMTAFVEDWLRQRRPRPGQPTSVVLTRHWVPLADSPPGSKMERPAVSPAVVSRKHE
jgi:fatty acid desaturase